MSDKKLRPFDDPDFDEKIRRCGICEGGYLSPEDVAFHLVMDIMNRAHRGQTLPCMMALVNVFQNSLNWACADGMEFSIADDGAIVVTYPLDETRMQVLRYDPSTGERTEETTLSADVIHEIAMDKSLPDDEEFVETLERRKERNCPEKPDSWWNEKRYEQSQS